MPYVRDLACAPRGPGHTMFGCLFAAAGILGFSSCTAGRGNACGVGHGPRVRLAPAQADLDPCAGEGTALAELTKGTGNYKKA